MEDAEFTARIKERIQRGAGKAVEFSIDEREEFKLEVDLGGAVPRVTLGKGALEYPGFARMGIEFAVASLRHGRQLTPTEFTVLLRRN